MRSFLAASLCLLSVAFGAGGVFADPPTAPPEPDVSAPETVSLNKAVTAIHDRKAAEAAAAQAAYEAQLADYRHEKDRIAEAEKKQAADYQAQAAAYQASLATWRENAGKPAPKKQSTPAPDRRETLAANATGSERRQCSLQRVTGSLVQTMRVCSTASERREVSDKARTVLAAPTSGCGKVSCN